MSNVERRIRRSPTWHLTAIVLVAAFAAALVLSVSLRVEITARGIGRIVPKTRVQVIQPEFAGRITGIHARDGHHVKKGAILVEFDPTEAAASVHALDHEIDQIKIERLRIESLLAFINDVTDGININAQRAVDSFTGHGGLRGESRHFDEHRALLSSEIAEIMDRLAQIRARQNVSEKTQAVVKANIAQFEAVQKIQAERLHMSEQLRERGTTSQSAHLDVLEAFVGLEKQMDVQRRQLDEKNSERIALDAERLQLLSQRRHRHTQRRAEIAHRMLAAKEELRVAMRRLASTKLLAPVEGTVDGLNIHTIGGVVHAGDELMRVVPAKGGIEVEAFFPNAEFGFLARNQQANVNLDAYPAERFGFVKGRVVDVSADATKLNGQGWGFIVRIALDAPHIEASDSRHTLLPGMTATIDVITGNRRLISYFFAPIIETIQGSMGER